MVAQNLESALISWRAQLGEARVLGAVEAAGRYGMDTSGVGRSVAAALLVKDRSEVGPALEIARRHRVALYPISTGNNWGYGGASPVTDGCVVVDLSGMNRIVEMDPELGLVTVEPGVTQGQLRAYLDRHAPHFMVPTTGAGPSCSLLGNALERGYGITPYADHFGAVTALEAVLPDGRVYRSALAAHGADTIDRAFKWGIGPYLDGIFTQGSFGIVTQMTIALAPRPERLEAFYFGITDEAALGAAVAAVQRLLRELGGTIGSINLMNARRVLAMTAPWPRAAAGSDGVLPQDVLRDLARRHQVRAWMGVGALYGDRAIVAAARGIVRRLLRPVADRIVFMTPQRAAFIGGMIRFVPGLRHVSELCGVADVAALLRAVDQSLDLMGGRPSEMALQLAYWRAPRLPPKDTLNPARDGSGLIWYSPIVPMKPAVVNDYVAMVHAICVAHGIEPLITLTSLTDRCFDSTVPLLFDRNDEAQTGRARACFDALYAAGESRGLLPYRFGIQAMSRMTGTASPFWDLVGRIKAALDPDNIISPGRYAPLPVPDRSSPPMGAGDTCAASDSGRVN